MPETLRGPPNLPTPPPRDLTSWVGSDPIKPADTSSGIVLIMTCRPHPPPLNGRWDLIRACPPSGVAHPSPVHPTHRHLDIRDSLCVARSAWSRAACHSLTGYLTGLLEGVRKVTSGTGDGNLTTGVSVSRGESEAPLCAGIAKEGYRRRSG
jgi:hypothetical protein